MILNKPSISALDGITQTGFLKTTATTGVLSVDTATYLSAIDQTANYTWTGLHTFASTAPIVVTDDSSLGSDLITNGGFASASNWSVNAGWTISGGKANYTTSGGGGLYQQNLGLSNVALGKMYKLTFTVSNLTSGGVLAQGFGWTGQVKTANGTYSEYIPATSLTYYQISFFSSPASARFSIDDVSLKLVNNGGVNITGANQGSYFYNPLTISANQSNYQLGTTSMIDLVNSGSYTFIQGRFVGYSEPRGAIGFTAQGQTTYYSATGYHYFYSGTTTANQIASISPSGADFTGNVRAVGGIVAGNGYYQSTLETAGSLGLKVKRLTASGALDGSATIYLCDASTAQACSGTPYACSHWGTSGDCNSHSSAGCSWGGSQSCQIYNYEYGMGNCLATGGCSADTAACTGGDQSSCESQDDSYGGSCSWSQIPTACTYGWDEGTCNSYGCSPEYAGNCGNYQDTSSGGCSSPPGGCYSTSIGCSTWNYDQGNCDGNGCYYESGSGNCLERCSGSYYSGCNGNYYNYQCTGTYFTGGCQGTFGGSCSGNASCAPLSQNDCGNESGCTWSSVMSVTLPQGSTAQDRNYWIYNDSGNSADVVISPYAGDKIDKTTSYTLSNYKDGIHIAYYRTLASCTGIGQGTCASTPGCTESYDSCSWDSENAVCTGTGSCSGYYDESACNSGQGAFSGCSGNYEVDKNWFIIGRT